MSFKVGGGGGTGGVTTGITETEALALIADWAETGQLPSVGWFFGVCGADDGYADWS